jgi:hypothetical protein
MQKKKNNWLSRGIVILFIISFYALIVCPGLFLHTRKLNEQPIQQTSIAKTLYKTIYSNDDSNSLIGFELHSNLQHHNFYGIHKECSVIVKAIDPKTEDYKTYCKDIVNDVIGMYGDTNITVNIYDSFEAYSLSLDEYALTKESEAIINAHKIAVFDSYFEQNDRYAYLTYYPYAANGLYEKMSYDGTPN